MRPFLSPLLLLGQMRTDHALSRRPLLTTAYLVDLLLTIHVHHVSLFPLLMRSTIRVTLAASIHVGESSLMWKSVFGLSGCSVERYR